MRIIYTITIAALCTTLCTPLFAESNSKGPKSAVVVGTLKSSSDSGFQVLQKGDHLRDLKLTNKSKIHYIGMPSSADHKPTVGYAVKAKVDKDGSIKSILFTQPVGKTSPLGNERLKMSAQALYAKVDADQNGGVDYVEFARAIYDSPKHGPDGFHKNDKDNSGMLDAKEFAKHLSTVAWWKLSRKTPTEWIKQADKDADGKLTVEEFKTICTSGNHIENVYRRTDKDKSGNLDAKETTAYIHSITGG